MKTVRYWTKSGGIALCLGLAVNSAHLPAFAEEAPPPVDFQKKSMDLGDVEITPAPPPTPVSDDDLVNSVREDRELRARKLQLSKAMEAANESNPMSDQFDRRIMNEVSKLFPDPVTREAVSRMLVHPKRGAFLWIELGWLVVMWVLTGYWLAHLKRWPVRFIARTFMFIALIGGAVFAIPALLFEEAYLTVARAAVQKSVYLWEQHGAQLLKASKN